MNLLYRILDTDEFGYHIHGFWHCLGLRLFSFRLRNWWTNHVRTIYNPQHSELRAAIPKTWSDLTGIIPDFLYACIITFVEGEKGLESWEYQDAEHPAKINASMLREVYEWAKTGRAAEIERIDKLHPPFEPGADLEEWLNREDPDRDACYKRVWEAESAFDEKDTKYLSWVVSIRENLWT